MANEAPKVVSRPEVVRRWISLVARLILGGAILYAGLLKIGDLPRSVTAVAAYELPIPAWMVTAIGYSVPIIEVALGAAIIAGLFTRWTALLGGLMMLVYIAAIASAWARGLSIDCGCFTPGGILLPGDKAKYLQDILRDIGFTICAVWVVVFPKSPIAVDNWINGPDTEEA